MIWAKDPGCPAVVGFGAPHVYDPPQPTRVWDRAMIQCGWRNLWGPRQPNGRPLVRGFYFNCVHVMYCRRCYQSVAIPPRDCPDWIDRPYEYTPRSDVGTYR